MYIVTHNLSCIGISQEYVTILRCLEALSTAVAIHLLFASIPIGLDKVRSSRVGAPGPNNEYLGRWLVECVVLMLLVLVVWLPLVVLSEQKAAFVLH